MSWEEMRREIINRGGPACTVEALRQAARRLKLTRMDETEILHERFRGVKVSVRKKIIDKVNQKLIQIKDPAMLEWLALKERNAAIKH